MNEHALRVLEFNIVRNELAGLTACSLGREKAEAMLPSDHLALVKEILKDTTECRSLIDLRGNLPLGGVTDIRPQIHRSTIGSSLDPRDLLDVQNTISSARSLKTFLQRLEDYPRMAAQAGSLGLYPTLEAEITACIAPNGQINDNATPDLARIRSRKKVTAQRMIDKLNTIVSGPMRTMLQDPVIVQRGERYCVPVKADHRGAFGGIVHDTSASGATLFMEPQAVVDLGNELKELSVKEANEVARILARLTDGVRRLAPSLTETVSALAQIDFTAARAKLSQVQNAVEPVLNSNGYTRLKAARHPGIDPEIVVPIDIELGGPENQILLVTGPNTGGKTVSLKTFGLITLMAQCGLHVPCRSAEVNLYYSVFADIGDEQSLQQSLSTFSGHIGNIVQIMRDMRPNSLVLLDEVGAGTDPAEGAALARAILEALRTQGARVIATSHYGELKTYAFSTLGVENASVEFDTNTLSPTYRLLQGIPGSSNAFAIAARLGLPESVLEGARLDWSGSNETVGLLQELEDGRRQAIQDAREAERARLEAQMLRRKYEKELEGLEALRREARDRMEAESRQLFRRAQDRLDNTLSELRKASSEGRETERARAKIKEIESDLQSAISQQVIVEEDTITDSAPSRPLRTGDHVRIPSLGVTGEVLDDERGLSIPVQVGSIRMNVPVATLRLIGDDRNGRTKKEKGEHRLPASPPEDKHEAAIPITFASNTNSHTAAGSDGGDMVQRALNITPQITLLGQRADEALRNVDKYIDEAYAAGLTRTRIVHGKGTGALRRAVQDYLAHNSLVESFATADADEGGAGVTVVLLRST